MNPLGDLRRVLVTTFRAAISRGPEPSPKWGVSRWSDGMLVPCPDWSAAVTLAKSLNDGMTPEDYAGDFYYVVPLEEETTNA